MKTLKPSVQKYLKIAAEGNQSIASTLTKFIGEMEYLFINAVKIDTLTTQERTGSSRTTCFKRQMRQEVEERKALETERKKIEKEETKYKIET